VEFCFENPEVPMEMVEFLVEKLTSKKKLKSYVSPQITKLLGFSIIAELIDDQPQSTMID
jgi:uncharacterized UBP type Zn finger protein